MFGLDELKTVIPPPTTPRLTMTATDWPLVFQGIGTRLPTDFTQTYLTYGDGYFYSNTHRSSANVSLYAGDPYHFSFSKFVPKRLTELRLLKEKRPSRVPFPLYWDSGGLLPWARATNDTDLCWKVRGDLVDDWHVVVLRTAKGEFEEFEMSAIQFLARVISGKVISNLLPMGFPGTGGVSFATWLASADPSGVKKAS